MCVLSMAKGTGSSGPGKIYKFHAYNHDIYFKLSNWLSLNNILVVKLIVLIFNNGFKIHP